MRPLSPASAQSEARSLTVSIDPSHSPADLVPLAAQLVMAYVTRNPVPAGAMPDLIASVHGALRTLGQPAVEPGPARATPEQIRKSITHGHLISFEDGKPYKALRRHLTLRGLTPEAYRSKWGLPADYPMTARSYSEARSQLAKTIGLGRPGAMVSRAEAA